MSGAESTLGTLDGEGGDGGDVEYEEIDQDLRVLASGSSSDQTLKRTNRARESNDTPGRFSIALDHSQSLLGIAKGQLRSGGEGVRAEMGYEGWRRGVFVSGVEWSGVSGASLAPLVTQPRAAQPNTRLRA